MIGAKAAKRWTDRWSMVTQAAYRPMLARQPILDVDDRLRGYELLYRSPAGVSRPSGAAMTARVLLDWFTAISEPLGDVPIWINFPAALLVDPDLVRTFPADQMVVEVLESVMVNDRIYEAVAGLKKDGYKIALDDWLPGDHRGELLELADSVKLDVLNLSARDIFREVAMLKGFDVEVVAEKVETWEHHQRCIEAGCDSFQGFYLATPQIKVGAMIPSPVLSSIQIISEISKEDWSVERLVNLIRPEPSLTTRILRLANATYLGARTPADSIREAVMRLGANSIVRWLVIFAMADANQGSSELTRLAITRARLTELLVERASPDSSDAAFTAGMLSAVPAMLGTSIDALVEQVAVSDELASAITSYEGTIGAKLEVAEQIENFAGSPVTESDVDLPELYLEASKWADEVVGNL
ncbi:MAG TPA: HDOD domain-containing protein [Actinobacteria bacterium]|nr:HDOD domain-containing protein [Actinomycetota bacterium]